MTFFGFSLKSLFSNGSLQLRPTLTGSRLLNIVSSNESHSTDTVDRKDISDHMLLLFCHTAQGKPIGTPEQSSQTQGGIAKESETIQKSPPSLSLPPHDQGQRVHGGPGRSRGRKGWSEFDGGGQQPPAGLHRTGHGACGGRSKVRFKVSPPETCEQDLLSSHCTAFSCFICTI